MNRGFIFLISFLLLLMPAPVIGKTSPELKKLIQESKARADIVAATQNAVVHIHVEKTIRSRTGGQHYNNPFDQFNDRFFDQLFPGLRNQRPYPGQPREFKQEGAGSGSIVDADGHILTNNHVVGEADKIKVRLFDGREFKAKIVGTDPLTDLAVIKIDADDLTILPMGDSDEIRIGETVIAVGNPFGLSHTVTMGIVSAKGRSNMDIADYEDFIQTDAAINPGNSGGPLVNLEGKIIGVNTAIFTRSGGYQGIGFSVPINMAKKVMDQLIDKGKVSRGWLGILLQDMSADLAKALDVDKNKGALVAEVSKDSPADRGGLERGDVILKLNGKLIKNADHLKNEVGLTAPDTKIQLEVIRKGDKKILSVKLGSRPTQGYAAAGHSDSGNALGLAVKNFTPELAKQYGYSQSASGVFITNVFPKTPAARTGLRPGMLILEINRRATGNVDDFREAIRSVDTKKGVLMLVGSQQGTQYIIIKDG